MTIEPKANDARRALQLCVDLERMMAAVYRDLSEIHAEDLELSRLWLKTAREEDNHANQFQLAMLYKDELVTMGVSAEEAEGLLKATREVRRRNAENPPHPVKALKTAVELEERLGAFHLESIAIFNSPKLKQLFGAMMAADQAHTESLRAMLTTRMDAASVDVQF